MEQPLDAKFNPDRVEQDPLDDLERHQATLKNESLFSGVNNFYQYQAPPIIPPTRYDESMSLVSNEALQLKRFMRRWSSWIVDFHWVYTLKYLIETLPTNKLAHFLKSYPILDNFIVHWMWWSYLLSKDLEVLTKDVFSGIGSMPWLVNDVRNDKPPQFTPSASSTAATGGRKHRNYSSTSSTSSFNGSRRSNNESRFMPKKMRENTMETEKLSTINMKNAADTSSKTEIAREIPNSSIRTKFLLLNKKSKELENINNKQSPSNLKSRLLKSSDHLNASSKLLSNDYKKIFNQLKQEAIILDLRINNFNDEEVASNSERTDSYEFLDKENANDDFMEEECKIESLSTSKENDELESTVVYLQNESIEPSNEMLVTSDNEPNEDQNPQNEQLETNDTQIQLEYFFSRTTNSLFSKFC